MQFLKKHGFLSRLLWVILCTSVVTAQAASPPRELTATGLIAVRDVVLTLLTWILLLLIHHALGNVVLKNLIKVQLNNVLAAALAIPTGLGISGSVIGLLGFVGILSREALAFYICLLVFSLSPRFSQVISSFTRALRKIPVRLGTVGFIRYAILASGAIAVISFLNSLTPPWSYDALMYHLPGPDQFLQAGRVFPNPDNWYVNGPFAIEMLFTLGLAIGDDILPKLIHWTFGLALFVITYGFSKEWFEEELGWLSVVILLTVPIIPIIAGFAYIDLAWATFEFAGLAALVTWGKDGDARLLILSGLMLGLAIASKYLGLMGLATAGILFLVIQSRRYRFQRFFFHSLILAIPVLIIGIPWYLKNLILLDNPVYPLYFGGPGWDQTRLDLYMGYLNEFGTGKRLKDFLLLPWNIYARHEEFGAVFNRNDIPSILFPLVLLLVFLPSTNQIKHLTFAGLIRFVCWSIGSHQIRFLLPLYPLLSILTAYTITQLIQRFEDRKLLGFFFKSLAVSLTFITIFYQARIMQTYRTIAVASGYLSSEEFLSEASRDFPAKRFLEESGIEDIQLLLLGNGRNFYCQVFCIPDPDHFRWSYEISRLESPEEVEQWLAERKITHILISLEDIGFLLDHDREDMVIKAHDTLSSYFDSGCLSVVFEDLNNSVYEHECD